MRTPAVRHTARARASLWQGPARAHLGYVHLSPPSQRTDLATLAYRGLTLILSVLAVVGQAAYLDALYWNALGLGPLSHGSLRPALLSAVITGAVVSLAAASLGTAMAIRGDTRRGARPLGLALAVWAYLLAYSGMIVLFAPPEGTFLNTVFDGHFLVLEALGLASLLRFTAVFPGHLDLMDLRAPDSLPPGLRTAQRVRIWLLRPAAPWILALGAAAISFAVNTFLGRQLQDTALLALVDLFRLTALTLVVLNLRHAFMSADAGVRSRMVWIVLGFALLVGAVGFVLGGNVLTAVTGWELPRMNWRPIVLDVGVLGLLWGGAMAVFYNGPMDPARLVRRAAIVGGMGTVTLFLSAGLEMLLSGVVAARFSLPYGAGTILGVVAMGVLYTRTVRPLDAFLSQTWSDVSPTLMPDDGQERPVA